MAYVHGKSSVVKIATFDLSTYIKNSSLEMSSDSHDVTGYGPTGDARIKMPGLLDGKFSCSGVYDDTTTGPRAKLQPLVHTTVAIIRQPAGAGTGKTQDTFNAVFTKYVETPAFDGPITWTADFDISGPVTTAAQP